MIDRHSSARPQNYRQALPGYPVAAADKSSRKLLVVVRSFIIGICLFLPSQSCNWDAHVFRLLLVVMGVLGCLEFLEPESSPPISSGP